MARKFGDSFTAVGASVMDDTRCRTFFVDDLAPMQRRYEALRAFFVEERPLPEIARQFHYSHGGLRNLVSDFRSGLRSGTVAPFFLATGAVVPERDQPDRIFPK
jgi:hypothetical protein